MSWISIIVLVYFGICFQSSNYQICFWLFLFSMLSLKSAAICPNSKRYNINYFWKFVFFWKKIHSILLQLKSLSILDTDFRSNKSMPILKNQSLNLWNQWYSLKSNTKQIVIGADERKCKWLMSENISLCSCPCRIPLP